MRQQLEKMARFARAATTTVNEVTEAGLVNAFVVNSSGLSRRPRPPTLCFLMVTGAGWNLFASIRASSSHTSQNKVNIMIVAGNASVATVTIYKLNFAQTTAAAACMRQPVVLIKHFSALGTQHTLHSSMRHHHWSNEISNTISRVTLLADSRADASRISIAVCGQNLCTRSNIKNCDETQHS